MVLEGNRRHHLSRTSYFESISFPVQKGEKIFRKKGRTALFKLNLGIEKDKKETLESQ